MVDYEVIVVGAGLSGALVAGALAGSGVRVLAADAAATPAQRELVILTGALLAQVAKFLMTPAIAFLAAVDAQRISTVTLRERGGRNLYSLPQWWGEELHYAASDRVVSWLRARAQALGAMLRYDAVTSVSPTSSSARVAFARDVLTCTRVIDCAGASATFSRPGGVLTSISPLTSTFFPARDPTPSAVIALERLETPLPSAAWVLPFSGVTLLSARPAPSALARAYAPLPATDAKPSPARAAFALPADRAWAGPSFLRLGSGSAAVPLPNFRANMAAFSAELAVQHRHAVHGEAEDSWAQAMAQRHVFTWMAAAVGALRLVGALPEDEGEEGRKKKEDGGALREVVLAKVVKEFPLVRTEGAMGAERGVQELVEYFFAVDAEDGQRRGEKPFLAANPHGCRVASAALWWTMAMGGAETMFGEWGWLRAAKGKTRLLGVPGMRDMSRLEEEAHDRARGAALLALRAGVRTVDLVAGRYIAPEFWWKNVEKTHDTYLYLVITAFGVFFIISVMIL